MNNFLKTFFAALLAFVVGSILTVILMAMIFAGFAALFSPEAPEVSNRSVLQIDLSSSIVDSPVDMFTNFDFVNMTVKSSNTVLEAVNAIEAAAHDDRIKGILINLEGTGMMSMTNAEELRAAVKKFRESGKFVVSYANYYSQADYYLSSVGDMVAMNPEGSVTWTGLSAAVMFYKGLMEKLNIEVDIIRHGVFKAAIEPFVLDKMSPENRLQMSKYVNSLWEVLLEDISESRGIPVEKLNEYADNLSLGSALAARELNFVDNLWYRDQMMNYLGALADGVAPGDYDADAEYDMPEFVSLGTYSRHHKMNRKNTAPDKIGIVYADGQIIDGESTNNAIGGDSVAKLLRRARKDDSIKAVVFRVNSPGGSALASEVIWREVELLRAVKPVIVSMGAYAASGGYYISAPADAIIAGRSTLTGSIGVFGMIPNLEKTFRNKLGITVDVVNSNRHSSMANGFGRLSPEEKAFFMNSVENVYSTFIGHVADGRNMTREAVDTIGQGRVWLGADAVEIGLVDMHGGIRDAINLAAERVNISDNYGIVEVMDGDTSFFNVLLNMSASVKESMVKDELGDLYNEYRGIRTMMEQEAGVQAVLPFKVEVR